VFELKGNLVKNQTVPATVILVPIFGMLDIQLHVTGKYFPGRPISRRESGDLPFSKQ
jgi:hypothetical protein